MNLLAGLRCGLESLRSVNADEDPDAWRFITDADEDTTLDPLAFRSLETKDGTEEDPDAWRLITDADEDTTLDPLAFRSLETKDGTEEDPDAWRLITDADEDTTLDPLAFRSLETNDGANGATLIPYLRRYSSIFSIHS